MVRENPGAGPPYQIRYSALNDNGRWVNLPWIDLADAEILISLTWKKGTGAADGEFQLYLDRVQVASRTSFNNDDRTLGAQVIGNLGLFKPGTLATMYWDQFRSFGQP